MIGLIIGFICAVICVVVAQNKGRNVVGWFFLGLFFGIFALIAACIVSDLNARAAKDQAIEHEQRRLREQLHQERIKNERLREYTQNRLDKHDQLLHVDTRHVEDHLPGADMPLLEEPAEQEGAFEPPSAESANLQLEDYWYYQLADSVIGPVTREAILSCIRQGKINMQTNVWHASIDAWKPVEEVRVLRMGDNV